MKLINIHLNSFIEVTQEFMKYNFMDISIKSYIDLIMLTGAQRYPPFGEVVPFVAHVNTWKRMKL